jgi:flagellar motor switch protein FliG
MGAKKFSSAEKAAIIVASLGEDLAPKIFSQMNSDEIGKIGRSLKNLGRLELSEIEETLSEFLSLLQSPKSQALDAQSFIDKMAKKTGRNGLSLADSFGPGEYRMRVFDRTRPELLFRIIDQDKPQTLALILSHAPSSFAAPLLKIFPERLRLDVLIRMAKLQEVDPLLIQELDEHLMRELDKLGHGSSQKIGGIKKVAEILNAMHQEAPELLNKISERNSIMAGDIQQEMFTFEDLLKIDVKGIQEIVKTVKREALILAMRGASPLLLNHFVSSMSERSGAMFREDLEALGGQKKSDVMSARTQLLDLTRSLIDSGKIQVMSDSNQYV